MIWCCVVFGIGRGGIEIKFPSVITCFDGLTKSRCESADFYGELLAKDSVFVEHPPSKLDILFLKV